MNAKLSATDKQKEALSQDRRRFLPSAVGAGLAFRANLVFEPVPRPNRAIG